MRLGTLSDTGDTAVFMDTVVRHGTKFAEKKNCSVQEILGAFQDFKGQPKTVNRYSGGRNDR